MSNKSRQGFVRHHTYKRLEKYCEYLELVLQAEKKKVEILKLVRPSSRWGKLKCRLGRHDLKTFVESEEAFAVRKLCKRCYNVFAIDENLKWRKVEEKNAKEKH